MYNFNFTQHNQYRIHKPDRSVLLNWANPLTRQLGFYVNFADAPTAAGAAGFPVFELLSRTKQTPSSATLVTSSGVLDLGTALDFTGAAASRVQWNVSTTPVTLPNMLPVFSVDSLFTVGVKFRAPAIPAANQTIFGFATSATDRWGISNQVTTGTIEFNTLNTTNTLTAANYCTGNWFTVFAYHIPGAAQGLAIYDSTGILLERIDTGSTSNYTGGTAGDLTLGGISGGSATNNFIGKVEWAGIWPLRLLAPQEMQALASNPYQIFNAPAFKRRWLDTSVSAAGTKFIALVGGPSGGAGMSLAGAGGGLAG